MLVRAHEGSTQPFQSEQKLRTLLVSALPHADDGAHPAVVLVMPGTKLPGGQKVFKYSMVLTEDNRNSLEQLSYDQHMSRNAAINRAIQVLVILRRLAGDTGTVVITYPDKEDVVVIL